MKRRRVVAYVTRVRDGQTELLVFEDPKHRHTGVQVPAGRLEPDEALEDGLLREIGEETGLEHVRVVRELAGFEEHYPSRYENHGFQVVLESDSRDEWGTSSTGTVTTRASSSGSAGCRSRPTCACSDAPIRSWSASPSR